ncbi:MAG: hypothetical protein II193_09950 [Lachnospiraceae bacterium]|nr:hypothetical protein [Lachnospiraceae bacterium]
MKDMNITINDTKQASTVKRAVADSVATEKEAIRQEKESEKLKTNIEINNQESLEVRKGSEKKLVAKKAVNNVVETVVKEEVIKKTSEKVVLQIQGRPDMNMNELVDRVKAAYVAEGHSADSIENVEVYIKLSENMAYYVIDGYASGISLFN